MFKNETTQVAAAIVVVSVVAFAAGNVAGAVINHISPSLKLNLKPWKKN